MGALASPEPLGCGKEVVTPAERGIVWVGCAKLVVSGFFHHLSGRKRSLEGWEAFPPSSGLG